MKRLLRFPLEFGSPPFSLLATVSMVETIAVALPLKITENL